MKYWLEIQRAAGIDKRSLMRGEADALAEGACPGCNTEPFVVECGGLEQVAVGKWRACGVAKCCRDSVGYVFAESETLFGAEEDRAMLSFARCRVYGGGLRQ